ncbi:MAG TPA: LemA family protein [Anaerohalosphaeraceae bacterium]|nr:LemA family protein [Anaerohalosphaeraceae bacterium]
MPVLFGLVILGLIVLVPVLMYNSLVGKRNQVANIFGTMDAMLKKRWDLVPNLVETVKGYAQHEKSLFENVTAARSRAMGGQMSADEMVQYDNAVSKLVGVMRATVENYPQLKAGENFLHLQRTLNELEEQISAARRAFNAAVTDYNNSVDMFPTNIIASMFGFQRKGLLEFEAQARQNPTVGF